MGDLVERAAVAGHAAVQSLLAEYDADHNRPVSQRECDEAFARAIIPMVLEEAAKRVEGLMECDGLIDADEATAAIRAMGAP